MNMNGLFHVSFEKYSEFFYRNTPTNKDVGRFNKSLPIVYSSKYNVKFFGLEKFHPFDASKWGNIIQVTT